MLTEADTMPVLSLGKGDETTQVHGRGAGAVAWPLAVCAQQLATPVIGFLGSTSADEYAIRLTAFRQGLKEMGYVEGQSVKIEYRWAESQNKRLPALAAELVHLRAAVIVAGGRH